MEKNSAKFVKLLENMRCHSFKISCIIDSIAIFRTQSHIQGGAFCYDSKHLTMLCLHGKLSLMFGSLR